VVELRLEGRRLRWCLRSPRLQSPESDYRTRFVRSAPPSVTVASAPLPPPSGPLTRPDAEPKPPVASSSSFTEDDIVEPPPRLPFVTNAAYIADFAVAKHAATRHGADTLFSIGRAACSIRESISDTGAGPSIIGTQILARLPADAAVSRSDDRATVDEEITGANGQPFVLMLKPQLSPWSVLYYGSC
jgi:hypothetical protein